MVCKIRHWFCNLRHIFKAPNCTKRAIIFYDERKDIKKALILGKTLQYSSKVYGTASASKLFIKAADLKDTCTPSSVQKGETTHITKLQQGTAYSSYGTKKEIAYMVIGSKLVQCLCAF